MRMIECQLKHATIAFLVEYGAQAHVPIEGSSALFLHCREHKPSGVFCGDGS